MGLFHTLRENIKLSIWDYVDRVHRILRWMNLFVSSFTMGVIIYYYGFPLEEKTKLICNIIIHCSLLFYVLKFILSTIFSIHSFQYIKKHKFETFIVIFISIWFIVSNILGYGMFGLLGHKGESFTDIIMLLVQVCFLIFILNELSYIGHFLGQLKIKTGGLLIISFLFLITAGTFLLLLPEMSTNGISFSDAMFTATSASCVTGLSTLDIGTVFTHKGQFIIMLLIQLGGINIVCFASFLIYFNKGGILRYQSVLKDMMNNTSLQGTRRMTREIVLFTIIIELIGFTFLFIYLNITQKYSGNVSENVFLSAFHSIASFNNSGFCFIDGGMTNDFFRYDYYIQSVTMFLILVGGIGFLTINDILLVPEGFQNRWTRMQITSKVVLKLTLFFVLFGAVSFFLLEYNNANKDSSLTDRIFTALFTSISSRTAGFNIVEIPSLNMATRLIIIILMLIGAAPYSTGGGIKLTTVYILFKSAITTITGKKQVTILNRSVSYDTVDKAYVILLFTIVVILTGSMILTISESNFTMEEIFFEVASAFGTSGLSSGIISELSSFGKYVIIVMMFIGRITVLTLALSLVRRSFARYTLVETNFGI